MSDLDQRPVKDEWKIVTDPNDPSIMKMFLNGQKFEVNSFGLGRRNKKGKCVMKLEVLIDLDQLTTTHDTREGHSKEWRATQDKFVSKIESKSGEFYAHKLVDDLSGAIILQKDMTGAEVLDAYLNGVHAIPIDLNKE
jgi:hypothetical protein